MSITQISGKLAIYGSTPGNRAVRCPRISVIIAILACCLEIGIGGPADAGTIRAAGDTPVSSADPRQSMAAAKQCIAQKDYSGALFLLRPFAAQPERYPRHYSDYLTTLFWSGNPRQAIRLYEAMPESIPKRDYLKRNMAKAYYDTGNPAAAISLYRSVLDNAPDDAVALEGLLRSMAAAGQGKEAVDRLNRILLGSKRKLDLHLLYPYLLVDLGRYRDALNAFDRILVDFPGQADLVARRRDDRFSALSEKERPLALGPVETAANAGDAHAAGQYVLLLALFRDYPAAVSAFDHYGLMPDDLPSHTAYWAGWAFFKTGAPDRAMAIFDGILKRDPQHLRSRIGRAYCLVAGGNIATALSMLGAMAARNPENLETLYAMAYANERGNRFWEAIGIYDRMLSISPGNPTVKRLRIRAFSDMGASTHALFLAETQLPGDGDLAAGLRGDTAVDRIRWDEPAVAIAILQSLPTVPEIDRFDYDRIVALSRDARHREAVTLYEALLARGKKPPPWVLEAVAGSYLYLEQSETALEAYGRVLTTHPDSTAARTGKVEALRELRRWEPARTLLDEMDTSTAEYLGQGRNRRYNFEKQDLAIARGWSLAYENRLKAADTHFQDLYEKAPANLEIRNALAHIHLWRNWPRRALEEFDIIQSMAPEYQSPKTGRIAALNALGFKEKARDQANALFQQNPRQKWVQKLVRQFAVEQLSENRFEFAFSREEDGATDILLRDTVSTPLSLYTRLYGFMLWRRTWNNDPDETARALGDDKATYFNRAGVGGDHIFGSDWTATQQFSVDYDNGEEFGSLSRVVWTPDDHWRVSGLVDTFSTDVAKRARAAGVTAKKLQAGVAYGESEWREYHVSGSRQLFSDDNERDEFLLGYEQNLFVKNDWRMRIYLNLYGIRNSGWDNPEIDYFNPKSAWGLSFTHMTEQTVRDMYGKSFVHRLYLTVGNYDQHAYSSGPVGSARYEQEYEFSDIHSLSWGATWGRNLYDGDSVDSIGLDAVWTVRF